MEREKKENLTPKPEIPPIKLPASLAEVRRIQYDILKSLKRIKIK